MEYWQPEDLDTISDVQSKLASGFLKSRPQGWFANLNMQWQVLLQSFNADLQIKAIRPSLVWPESLDYQYLGAINQETFAIATKAEDQEKIIAALSVSDLPEIANSIFSEYLARRLIASMSAAWTGPAFESVKFIGNTINTPIKFQAGVEIYCLLNSEPISIWILIGEQILSILDGLYRRQTRSIQNVQGVSVACGLEIGEVELPLIGLDNFLKSSQPIKVLSGRPGQAYVKLAGKKYLVRLLNCQGQYVLDPQNEVDLRQASPKTPGTMRAVVQLGSFNLDPVSQSQINVKGQYLNTELALQNSVQLTIDGQSLANGKLLVEADQFYLSLQIS